MATGGLRRPTPDDFSWSEVALTVDGEQIAFDKGDVGDGVWVLVGRVGGTTVSVEGNGVPVAQVELYRLTDDLIPPPPRPQLAGDEGGLLDALDERFERIPFHRIRRSADRWALRGVEADHLQKRLHPDQVAPGDAEAIRSYWLERVDTEVCNRVEHLRAPRPVARPPSRVARRLGRRWWLYQLWFNTFGSGGRTWFGNRYTTVRHYTFRIRWRP